MHHQFKGSLRKVYQDEAPSTTNYNNLPQTYQPNKYDNFYRTERSERSEYSTMNKFQTTTNFEKDNSLRYIYDKNIPVKVSSPQRTEHETYLRVEMEVTNDKPSSVIKINLTDDGNHTFLWCFYLRDVDYTHFKNEQKLKVDFSEFSSSLMRILDSLIEFPKKYICRFEIEKSSKGSLKVLESNQFKENLNLELKLKEATNEQLIEYLDQKLKKLEQREFEMGIQIQKQGEQISKQNVNAEELQIRLRQLESERKEQFNNISLDNRTKLTTLKEQFLNKQMAFKKDSENQKKQIVQKYETEMNKVKDKLSQLNRKYELVLESSQRLQSKNRELESRANILATENQNFIKNYQIAKQDLGKNQMNINEYVKSNIELKCNLDSLKRQLEDKDIIIESTKEIKTNQSSQVQSLENTVAELRKELEKKDKLIKQNMHEFGKLKAMVENYSTKIKEKNARLKEKDETMINVHKFNQELKKKDQNNERHLGLMRKEKEILESEVNGLKSKVATLDKVIEEDKVAITNSKNIIDHLNRQLTERTNPGKIGPTSSIMQSTYRTSFNYEPTGLSKSSLSPSIPMPAGERFQPEVKRYTGNTQIPILKTENNPLNQQQQPGQSHTVRVNAVKYRSPSQTRL